MPCVLDSATYSGRSLSSIATCHERSFIYPCSFDCLAIFRAELANTATVFQIIGELIRTGGQYCQVGQLDEFSLLLA